MRELKQINGKFIIDEKEINVFNKIKFSKEQGAKKAIKILSACDLLKTLSKTDNK